MKLRGLQDAVKRSEPRQVEIDPTPYLILTSVTLGELFRDLRYFTDQQVQWPGIDGWWSVTQMRLIAVEPEKFNVALSVTKFADDPVQTTLVGEETKVVTIRRPLKTYERHCDDPEQYGPRCCYINELKPGDLIQLNSKYGGVTVARVDHVITVTEHTTEIAFTDGQEVDAIVKQSRLIIGMPPHGQWWPK